MSLLVSGVAAGARTTGILRNRTPRTDFTCKKQSNHPEHFKETGLTKILGKMAARKAQSLASRAEGKIYKTLLRGQKDIEYMEFRREADEDKLKTAPKVVQQYLNFLWQQEGDLLAYQPEAVKWFLKQWEHCKTFRRNSGGTPWGCKTKVEHRGMLDSCMKKTDRQLPYFWKLDYCMQFAKIDGPGSHTGCRETEELQKCDGKSKCDIIPSYLVDLRYPCERFWKWKAADFLPFDVSETNTEPLECVYGESSCVEAPHQHIVVRAREDGVQLNKKEEALIALRYLLFRLKYYFKDMNPWDRNQTPDKFKRTDLEIAAGKKLSKKKQQRYAYLRLLRIHYKALNLFFEEKLEEKVMSETWDKMTPEEQEEFKRTRARMWEEHKLNSEQWKKTRPETKKWEEASGGWETYTR